MKWIMRFLRSIIKNGVVYAHEDNNRLINFVDSNDVWDLDMRKSTIGYKFTLGGGAISWS